MSYPPDPGGVFASDAHRRTMANLPNPDEDPLSVEDLIAERVLLDGHLANVISADGLVEVLKDLEADGHAKQLKGGWKNTPNGFDALTAEPELQTGEPPEPREGVLGLDPAAGFGDAGVGAIRRNLRGT